MTTDWWFLLRSKIIVVVGDLPFSLCVLDSCVCSTSNTTLDSYVCRTVICSLLILVRNCLLEIIKHTFASNLFISSYRIDIAVSFFFVHIDWMAFGVVVCSVKFSLSPYSVELFLCLSTFQPIESLVIWFDRFWSHWFVYESNCWCVVSCDSCCWLLVAHILKSGF